MSTPTLAQCGRFSPKKGVKPFEVDTAPTAEDPAHALVRFADRTNQPASPRFERDKLLDVFRNPDFNAGQ